MLDSLNTESVQWYESSFILKVLKCEIFMSWILMIFLSWSLYR